MKKIAPMITQGVLFGLSLIAAALSIFILIYVLLITTQGLMNTYLLLIIPVLIVGVLLSAASFFFSVLFAANKLCRAALVLSILSFLCLITSVILLFAAA